MLVAFIVLCLISGAVCLLKFFWQSADKGKPNSILWIFAATLCLGISSIVLVFSMAELGGIGRSRSDVASFSQT